MLYVVCVYIVVCGICLIILPTDMTEERKAKGTIFDKDTEIDKKVKEHQKDVPHLILED